MTLKTRNIYTRYNQNQPCPNCGNHKYNCQAKQVTSAIYCRGRNFTNLNYHSDRINTASTCSYPRNRWKPVRKRNGISSSWRTQLLPLIQKELGGEG